MSFIPAHNSEALRAIMVREQLASRGIDDARVLAAMGAVPREAFVPDGLRAQAYDDNALSIGSEQTISQPYIVALMVQALELEPEDRVLEVGGGSGYAAAVMARVAREVVTVELVPELAQRAAATIAALGIANVRVLCGDGARGLADQGPFEAISVAAAGRRIPPALVAQLAPGGRMVIPVGPHGGDQRLVRIRRGRGGELVEEELLPVRFVPLIESGD